jgi:hypothetical protein
VKQCLPLTLVLALATAAMLAADPAKPAASAPTSIPLGPAKPAPVGPLLTDWWAGAQSPIYARASAHSPHFEDRTLWPVTGKEAYLSQKWAPARLLVWANPGKRGAAKNPRPGELLVTDLANWVEYPPGEDGKPAPESRPATKLWDKETDIYIPDWENPPREEPYEVTMRDCGVKQEFRHVTVGRRVAFNGGGDGVGRQIHGNVWVRAGGSMGTQGATSLLGEAHTFIRNDNDPRTLDPRGRQSRLFGLTQYYSFNKPAGVTIEIIGHVQTGDEFGVHKCTLIVAPDSCVRPGRNAAPAVKEGGVLALMDNAVFANWSNSMDVPDLQVKGTVQGGMPDRPLTRPATLGLAFKNHTKSDYTGPKRNMMNKVGRTVCLALEEGSSLRSYSARPDAKLVIGTMGEMGDWDRRAPRGSDYEKEQVRRGDGGFHLWYDMLPRGSDIYFAAGVTVDGVQFDYIRKGGLLMPDVSAVQGWKNVSYGPNCLGKPAELPARLEKMERGWRY